MPQDQQQRAQELTRWVVQALRDAGIAAKLKYVVGPHGHPVLLVYSRQQAEASLTLPPYANGFYLRCV